MSMALESERQISLAQLVDVEMLQSLTDRFAALSGISTSIRDAEGNALTRPAGQSAFCALMQSSPSGAEACARSHAEFAQTVRRTPVPGGRNEVGAGRKNGATGQPCLTRCHAGLSQFVAPIMVGDCMVGTIIVGDRPASPGMTDDGDAGPAAETDGAEPVSAVHQGRKDPCLNLEELSRLHGLDLAALREAAAGLRPWSAGEMSAATAFVQQLANTIAQLCYQAQQLRSRVDELAALYDVASLMAGKADVQEILDTAARQLVETMGFKAVSLRLLDEETGELRLAALANLSKGYVEKGPIFLETSLVDQLALRGETTYVRDLASDSRILYPEMARREGLVSALATAVSFQGRRIGVLQAYTGNLHRFTPFEVSHLEAVASLLGAAIVNARLRRDAHEREHLRRQLRLAADVQRRMIPARPPASPHYEFGCVYEPSSELGGDFYDFIHFDNGDIGVVVADVVGKGVPASLMMASARSALRSNARRVTDLGEIMQSVNRRLCHDTLPSEFVTAFYLELGRDGRSLKYCNAGHEPMLLLRRGEIRALDAGGLALGIEENERYESAEEPLEPGDVLLLLTDGLTEARTYDGRAYGRERVHASLRLHADLAPDMPVELIAKQLLWDVRRFVGLAPMSDDLTLVVIRVGHGDA